MKTQLLLALSLIACGKDSKGGGGAAPAVTIDVAGVNALVPAELKEKLVFEQTDITEERGRDKVTYTMAAPKGWEGGEMKMFAKVHPKTVGSEWGNSTDISVGSNCDGTCEPKDWAKTSEKVNFAQFRDAKIIKDELGKTSHLMIAERDGTTYVMYAWWREGAKKYFTCMATLEPPFGADPKPNVGAAAPAFAKACQAVAVKGDD